MSKFTVTAAQLRATANELVELNGQYQQQVGRLLENKDELQGMWEGDAKATFDAAFARGYESLNDFYRVIAEHIRVLNAAAIKYETAEQQAVEIAKC